MNVTKISKPKLKEVPVRKGKPIDFKRMNRTLDWQRKVVDMHRASSKAVARYCVPRNTCPICSSGKYKHFANVFDYLYSQCETCGHVFMHSPPDEQAVLNLYSDQNDSNCVQRQIYIDEEMFKNRIEQIAKPKVEYCSSTIPVEGVWTDLGCGTGELLAAASERGWKAKGYEIDPAEVAFGRNQGLEIFERNLNSLSADDLQDTKVLSFINLLEHIREPADVLEKLTRLLPMNAYVVIEVPRHPSLSSFANVAFPHLAYRHMYSPDHLHIFTEPSMQTMLDRAGLQPVSKWQFGQDCQQLIANTAANANLEENKLYHKILEFSVAAQKIVDEMDLSDTLFLIARKRN